MPKKRKGGVEEGRGTTFRSEDLGYNPDEFHNPSHDERGVSVAITFRVPPPMQRQLEVIRDVHRFPYDTISDILRHAVVRHLDWLQVMAPNVPKHILHGLHAVLEVCRDSDMRVRIEEGFVALERLIMRRLDEGDRNEALRLMSVARSRITPMPDNLWKTKWVESFNRKYGGYLTIAAAPAPMAQVEAPASAPAYLPDVPEEEELNGHPAPTYRADVPEPPEGEE